MIQVLGLILAFMVYDDERRHREWERSKGD